MRYAIHYKTSALLHGNNPKYGPVCIVIVIFYHTSVTSSICYLLTLSYSFYQSLDRHDRNMYREGQGEIEVNRNNNQ